VVVDRAAKEASASSARVAAWADDAFGRLSGRAGVRRVGLALVEGGGRRLRFTASDRDGSATAWCHVDAYDDVPLNAAVRSGSPVIGTVDELAGAYPQFVENQRATATVGLAAVPLVTADRILGGFVLYYDQLPLLDVPHRRELVRLGRTLGAGLRNAQRVRRRGATPGGPPDDAPVGALVAVHDVRPDPAAVGESRQFLRATLRGWRVDDSVADAAVLCLSELVTNALVHAYDGCLVRAVLHEAVVRVSVRNTGAGAAQVAPAADPLQVHGRGLQLVEALSSHWGHQVDDGGLAVWFEIEAG
jgi:anti-sigma regulatory factor (Ser/Thr protein kinase)